MAAAALSQYAYCAIIVFVAVWRWYCGPFHPCAGTVGLLWADSRITIRRNDNRISNKDTHVCADSCVYVCAPPCVSFLAADYMNSGEAACLVVFSLACPLCLLSCPHACSPAACLPAISPACLIALVLACVLSCSLPYVCHCLLIPLQKFLSLRCHQYHYCFASC